jgi:hypothetical protein
MENTQNIGKEQVKLVVQKLIHNILAKSAKTKKRYLELKELERSLINKCFIHIYETIKEKHDEYVKFANETPEHDFVLEIGTKYDVYSTRHILSKKDGIYTLRFNERKPIKFEHLETLQVNNIYGFEGEYSPKKLFEKEETIPFHRETIFTEEELQLMKELLEVKKQVEQNNVSTLKISRIKKPEDIVKYTEKDINHNIQGLGWSYDIELNLEENIDKIKEISDKIEEITKYQGTGIMMCIFYLQEHNINYYQETMKSFPYDAYLSACNEYENMVGIPESSYQKRNNCLEYLTENGHLWKTTHSLGFGDLSSDLYKIDGSSELINLLFELNWPSV